MLSSFTDGPDGCVYVHVMLTRGGIISVKKKLVYAGPNNFLNACGDELCKAVV